MTFGTQHPYKRKLTPNPNTPIIEAYTMMVQLRKKLIIE